MEELERRIEYADVESLSLFSGFRGSGKTTELFRLRKRLRDAGVTVLYADALEYIDPASPVEIADLPIVLAGAFSDALVRERIDISVDSYWTRLRNSLANTDFGVKELGLKAGSEGAEVDLKLEFRTTPLFRQRLSKHMSGRIGELLSEVREFFEDGIKAVRKVRGEDAKVVFLFDSLEQIRGSLSNEHEVTHSVEVLFSTHLRSLEIPLCACCLHRAAMAQVRAAWLEYVCVAVPAPVEQRFRPIRMRLRRVGVELYGEEALWSRRSSALLWTRSAHAHWYADCALRRPLPRLLLLLRETVIRADTLPVPEEAIGRATVRVRSHFLPISIEDAKWLADIERERDTLLRTTDAVEVNRLTRFLDAHVVLYLKNGTEWYDVHLLVRDEVKQIVARAATAVTT